MSLYVMWNNFFDISMFCFSTIVQLWMGTNFVQISITFHLFNLLWCAFNLGLILLNPKYVNACHYNSFYL